MGLFWKLGHPVPFAFRTVDGKVRSLDAGCLKWLSNRNPPAVKFLLGKDGRIEAVEPSPELQNAYHSRKDELVDRITAKAKTQIT